MTDLDECAKRVGTLLREKWTLERLLGVGGMAAVYVGVHKIGRRDAIKILHPTVASSPEVRARFEQEAQAVNRFKHPGAVEIRDIDVTEDGAPFLVMELLEGETLSRIVRREPGPSIDDVLRWADELLDVLAAAHAQGIVHRDVKPDNLFVQTDGRLKVLDFGIARVKSGAAMSMKTATGATIGTVSYMPPEQARGRDIDARADIFAVGATMFRLIARRKIHEADSDIELLKKVATTPAPKLATAAASVPEAVARIVDRALEFDRDARYPDATSMQADVRAARSAATSELASSVPAIVAGEPSPLAASIETPASQRTGPDPSEVATVGRPRAMSLPTTVDPEPPAMSVPPSSSARDPIASTLPTRVESTLRSGPPPAPIAALRLPPVSRPAPSPIASARPASTNRSLPIIIGSVITAVVLVAAIVVTMLVMKSSPAVDANAQDAAPIADAADPIDAPATADDTTVPATPPPAASARKPAPTVPSKPIAPHPTAPHPTPHPK